MQTKYDTDQYVLVRAKVKSILMEGEEQTHYGIEINCDDFRMMGNLKGWVLEDQIVCGWIGEKDE